MVGRLILSKLNYCKVKNLMALPKNDYIPVGKTSLVFVSI